MNVRRAAAKGGSFFCMDSVHPYNRNAESGVYKKNHLIK